MFVILIQDRHTDPEAVLYKDKEKAIEEARIQAKQCCRLPEDYEEHDCGFIFYATYNCEHDSVTVLEAPIGDE